MKKLNYRRSKFPSKKFCKKSGKIMRLLFVRKWYSTKKSLPLLILNHISNILDDVMSLSNQHPIAWLLFYFCDFRSGQKKSFHIEKKYHLQWSMTRKGCDQKVSQEIDEKRWRMYQKKGSKSCINMTQLWKDFCKHAAKLFLVVLRWIFTKLIHCFTSH